MVLSIVLHRFGMFWDTFGLLEAAEELRNEAPDHFGVEEPQKHIVDVVQSDWCTVLEGQGLTESQATHSKACKQDTVWQVLCHAQATFQLAGQVVLVSLDT